LVKADIKEKFYQSLFNALWPFWNKIEMDKRKIWWVGYKDYVLINYPAIVKLHYKGRQVDGDYSYIEEKYPELYNDDWAVWAHEVITTIGDAIRHFQKLGVMKKPNIEP
jgi:hypothetical protein